MSRYLLPSFLLVSVLVASGAGRAALAAESYDNCSGFIDSVPASITAAGTWCMRHDVSTNMASGAAITILADDVVLDCNNFKLGGLAAGMSTFATGVHGGSSTGSGGRQYNVTVRNCNVRGFHYGIYISPGSGNGGGYLVEDNLVEQSRFVGILVGAGRNRVQRNRVVDTGGRPGQNYAFGISAHADLIDNTVTGVYGDAAVTSFIAYGIVLGDANGYLARGNHVSGLQPHGVNGQAWGLQSGNRSILVDNRVIAPAPGTAGGGLCGLSTGCLCKGNTAANFANPTVNCTDLGGNASH